MAQLMPFIPALRTSHNIINGVPNADVKSTGHGNIGISGHEDVILNPACLGHIDSGELADVSNSPAQHEPDSSIESTGCNMILESLPQTEDSRRCKFASADYDYLDHMKKLNSSSLDETNLDSAHQRKIKRDKTNDYKVDIWNHGETNSNLQSDGSHGSKYQDQLGDTDGNDTQAVSQSSDATPPSLGLDQSDFIYSPEVHIINLTDAKFCNKYGHGRLLETGMECSILPHTSTPISAAGCEELSFTDDRHCSSLVLEKESYSPVPVPPLALSFKVYQDDKSTKSSIHTVDKDADMEKANSVGGDVAGTTRVDVTEADSEVVQELEDEMKDHVMPLASRTVKRLTDVKTGGQIGLNTEAETDEVDRGVSALVEDVANVRLEGNKVLKTPQILITANEASLRHFSSSCVDSGGRPPTPIVRRLMDDSRIRACMFGTSCSSPVMCVGAQPKPAGMGTFQMLMEKKAKFVPAPLTLLKPKVDLLKLAAPPIELSPALTEVLTPAVESNLVPLNELATVEGCSCNSAPLYFVHSFNGSVRTFEAVAKKLQMPCYGVQRKTGTPSDTVENMASHYLEEIYRAHGCWPYILAGFGFGSLIVLEMAIQLQESGEQVEKLIMLDGSPLYIQMMLMCSIRSLPASATAEQINNAVVSGALLKWMETCGPVKKRGLVYGLMNKLSCKDEKILTAVDFTFGDAVLSPNTRQTRWLWARQKLKSRRGLLVKAGQFVDAAQEIVRLKRKEKATIYVDHVLMAKDYQPSVQLEGNIYLIRVKTPLMFGQREAIPADYGLGELCTGTVSIDMYDGEHDVLFKTAALGEMAQGISKMLMEM